MQCTLAVIYTLCNMAQKSRCVALLALCFTFAAANDDFPIENGCTLKNQSCETHRLSTTLGSSILLPCNLTHNSQNTVISWIQSPSVTVVTITSGGWVNFSEPRFGRISTFPNQGSRGNYSISIDNVNQADFGCYQCLNQDDCVQVELALKKESDVIWLFPFSIYIISGVALIFVVVVGCFLYVHFIFNRNKDTEENHIITAQDADDGPIDFPTLGVGDPAQEIRRVPGDGQPQDAQPPSSPAYVNSIVYENDGHVEDEPDYLNEIPGHSGMNREEVSHRGYFNFESVESQKTKQRFHTELMNRLRQASIRKHYYVNQDELRKSQDTGSTKGSKKKKRKAYRQYPNPIYNRSTDGLDQM